MNKMLSFDDVLIVPSFSHIRSRKDVSLFTYFCGMELDLPIISSNMDTVTHHTMAVAMAMNGGVGSLHRFETIEENVNTFKESVVYGSTVIKPIVSIGLGEKELQRAEALINAGAETILIDIAHGACMSLVEQVRDLREICSNNIKIIAGNFATGRSILDVKYYLGSNCKVDAWKVGIGGGSACLTRVVTGCGLPTLASVMDCAQTNETIIADGGMKTSGDICKALAAGASMVMLGGMLAGTDEAPGAPVYQLDKTDNKIITHKKYRGSASTESYEVQGKIASHRSYEGDSFLVPYKGSVKDVLQQIEGGLRSALSYVGATTLDEFRANSELVEITNNGTKENGSHGRSQY